MISRLLLAFVIISLLATISEAGVLRLTYRGSKAVACKSAHAIKSAPSAAYKASKAVAKAGVKVIY